MLAFLQSIVGLSIIAPFIVIVLLFVITKYLINDQKRAIQLTADISTIFLVLSVHFLIFAIWKHHLFIYIYLSLLIIFFGIAYSIWRRNDKFKLAKTIRNFWRMNFLLFLMLYFILMIFGILSSAFSSLAVG